MPEDLTGPASVPVRQRAEVDWNRGASGPPPSALPPVGPPTRALLGNLPAQADGLILDLACGIGSPAFEAARRNPGARVLGVDRAHKLIDTARALAAAHAVGNADFEVMSLDALTLPDKPWTRRSHSSPSCQKATLPHRLRSCPVCSRTAHRSAWPPGTRWN